MPIHRMNPLAGKKPNDPLPPVSLRPESPGDESFLYAVYASTREEELALTNWDETMRQGYRSMFPAGEFWIIELDGKPAGRMVIHRDAAELRVVDLALLPAHRNQGVGTFLLRQLCAKADKPVRLSVLQHNRALRWYARLGFVKTGELGFYDELEWRPAANPVAPTG